MKNKVLITGGTGLLGKALVETLDSNHQIIATYAGNYQMNNTKNTSYKVLDVRDKDGYEKLFNEFNPDIVIHTASIGSPDYAEKYKDLTWEVNIKGLHNIIDLSEHIKSRFIFISSNGIYDGGNPPYKEDSKAEPINFYGYVKLWGEEIVKNAKTDFSIVRPILMYGWNYPFERQNIVTSLISKLKNKVKVYVYDDVFINPLFVNDCANAINEIISRNINDIYNIAGKEKMSIYKLVKEAAKIFECDTELVIPVKQGYFNELIRRPKDTTYDISKAEKRLGFTPKTVIEGLTLMKENNK